MRQFNIKWLGSFLSTMLLFSTLSAAEVAPETLKLISESSGKALETYEASEAEIVRDALDLQNEGKRDVLPKREQPTALADAEEAEEEIINEFSIGAYYSTSHRHAYHKPMNVTGDVVELEDQSIWQVHSWDVSKVKNWKRHHEIVIAPNKNIFTRWFYPYKFVNLHTHDVAKAKMKLSPVFNDPKVDIYVHWVQEIDYVRGLIRLEDGTLWNISISDSDVMREFIPFDVVIIGTNDGWFRGSNPNILINVRSKKYVRGGVIN